MSYTQRPYRGETDLPAMLALKQLCTTPQNVYDRPTTGEMRQLFTPFLERTAHANDQQSRAEAFRGMSSESRHRALTQRLTALWEDAGGQLVAYALIAQPGSSLTFQVHQKAQGQGLEEDILTWGLAQMQAMVHVRGFPRELWCRCHAIEQAKQNLLEAAGFLPLSERDLRLVHPLATPLSPISLPQGSALKRGVTQPELDAYQKLHQAVFEGTSMGMDYYESSTYQPDLAPLRGWANRTLRGVLPLPTQMGYRPAGRSPRWGGGRHRHPPSISGTGTGTSTPAHRAQPDASPWRHQCLFGNTGAKCAGPAPVHLGRLHPSFHLAMVHQNGGPFLSERWSETEPVKKWPHHFTVRRQNRSSGIASRWQCGRQQLCCLLIALERSFVC